MSESALLVAGATSDQSVNDISSPSLCGRRYDIDWLRVLAMCGVFFFHNARFFDPLPWHLKNAQHSTVALVFVGLLDRFQMPLLMFVSGAASWYALRSRGGGQYLLERVCRLLVPLYTVGLLLLIPPQYYWELVTNRGFSGSFREYIPLFLKTFSFAPDLRFLSFWHGHLWFLRDLFLISLLTLPALLYLKSHSAQRWLGRLAQACSGPLGVILPALLILSVHLSLCASLKPGHPLIDFLKYLTYFVVGFLAVSDARFTHALQRYAPLCLIAAVLTFAAMLGWVLRMGYQPWLVKVFSRQYALFTTLASLNTWLWVAAFIGLAARYLNFNNRVLAYANEAVLPFYVLHQTVILAIGLFVVRWHIGMGQKYVVIATSSFLAIMLLYELLIRRVDALRFLFGMRANRLRQTPVAQASCL